MAVRAAMSALIDYVERLVNDESNTHHTTQQIQDALDQSRMEARYWQLTEHETKASGGTVTYKVFTHYYGYWESNGTLLNYNYDSLSPSSSNWITGRWEFSTEPTRPVYILGYTYDVYAAAIELLNVRMSALAENYDFRTEGGAEFSRSQAAIGISKLIGQYQLKTRAGSPGGAGVNRLIRDDLVTYERL